MFKRNTIVFVVCLVIALSCSQPPSPELTTAPPKDIPLPPDDTGVVIQVSAVAYINSFRQALGMVSLATNDTLAQSASAHSHYVDANQVFGHGEEINRPGFTGDSASTRAVAAGYRSRLVSEGIANGASEAAAVDNLLSGIYHRFSLLDFTNDEIGTGFIAPTAQKSGVLTHNMGNRALSALCSGSEFSGGGSYYQNVCSPNTKISASIFDSTEDTAKRNNPEIVQWPPPEANDVPPAFFDETPDPLPNARVSGYPISLQFNPAFTHQVTLNECSLTDLDRHQAIDQAQQMDSANDPNQKLSKLEFALFPFARLHWATRYHVSCNFTREGVAGDLAWNFKTRTLPGTVIEATYSSRTIEIVNGSTTHIVFLPRDSNDIIADVISSYPSSMTVSTHLLDANTLTVKASGATGQTLSLTINGAATFTVKLI